MNSIERLVPDMVAPGDVTGEAALELHQKRYEFAARHAKPGRILDIACGVGYGTHFLAGSAGGIVEAVGVDISAQALEYARKHYSGGGIHFREHDAMTFTDPAGFDTIVSLETVEHVPDADALIGHLCGLLRSGGVLIASVPTTPSMDVNPYHLHDFTERSFRRMAAARGLQELACLRQVQPYPIVRVLRRQEARMKDMRPDLLSYYLRHPAAAAMRFWATVRYGFTNRYLTVAWQKAP